MKYYRSYGTCILISFIIASFSFSCQCQPNKPTAKWNMLVGGSASFDWSSAESTYQGQSLENYKENRSVCDLRFGFFPVNNLLTGISFNASLFNSKVESSPKVTSYDYLVTPFIRYYLKIGVFAETSFQFGYMAPLSSTRPEDNLLSTESYNIGIGYSLFLTDYLAIESTISYYLKKRIQINEDVLHRFNGIHTQIGLGIYLNAIRKQ